MVTHRSARRALACALLILGLGVAAPAVAQEPGVTYDPDSPAGRQYALPLDDVPMPATSKSPQADGTTPSTRPAPADPQAALFGAGISKPGSAPLEGSLSKDGSSGSGAKGAVRKSKTSSTGDEAGANDSTPAAKRPLAPAPAQRATQAAGISATAASLASAALVVLLGLAAAFAVRSGRRRPGSST